MDAQDKDNLVKSSMEKAFGVKGNGDQMDLSSANLLSFLQVKTVIEKDQDGLYAEYIEKIRQQEKAEFERLEKIKEKTEAEQQRLLEVSNSTLPAEEYYYLNLFNKQKAEGFAAENKELTDAWFKPLHEEVNEKAKELHKEYSKDNPNITFDICKAGALLSTLGDVLNDKRLKYALDAGKIMINPIGFTTSKVIGKAIGAALKTETGKNLISKAKDSWTSKFGESELSSKMNVPKVLGALATVGAIVTIATGLDTDTIGEIKNAFNETLETVSNAGSNLNIDNLLEVASNTDIDATNPYVMRAQEMMEAKYGAVEELAADVGVDPVELKQAAVQDAVLESGVDIKETIASKAEAIANEAINLPESITIQSGDRLESLVKDMLPKDASYSDIREMTQKIAEFNGVDDADHIMVGQEFKIPSGDVLKDIEIKDFKIESLDDLASLDKVPYGSSITPEEYAKQVETVMKGAYPNEPDRVHEMMAHVNAKMNDLPAGQPIESGTKIDLGKDYKELLVEKSRMISDEQESMYDFTEKQSVEEPKVDAPKVEEPKVDAPKVEQAEPVAAKAAAPEQAAETLTKVDPFDRHNYSVNHNVQNSELNALEVNGKQIDMENVPQEVKDILRLDQDELKQMRTERTLEHFRNKPDDYVSVRDIEREELADFFENNPEAYERMMNNQPPLSAEPEVTLAAQKVEAPELDDDVPQYMTQDAGRVNFDAGEMNDNPFGDETPELEEDVPQYMTQDAGRANFDAGEMDDNPFGDETPELEEDVPQYMTQDVGRANFDAGEMDDNPFEGDIDPKVEELQTFVKDFNTSYTLDEQKDMIAAGYYIAEQRGIEVHDVSEAVKVAQDAHIDFVNAQGLNPLHFDETDFSSQVVDKAGVNFDDDVPNFLANSVEPAYPEYSDVSPEEANLVVAKAEMLTANMDEKPYQTAEEAYEFVRSEHLKSMRDSGGVWMEDTNDMSMERSDIAKSFDGFVHDGISNDDVENLPRYLEHPDTYQSSSPDDEIVNGLKSEVNKDQSLSNNDQHLNRRNGLRNS